MPDDEVHTYQYKFPLSLSHSLKREKFDKFQNLTEEEYLEFQTLDKIEPRRLLKTNYEVLENGTWYSSISTMTGLDPTDSYTWEDYGYREFLDRPVDPIEGEYEENPMLMDLIERYIYQPLRSEE